MLRSRLAVTLLALTAGTVAVAAVQPLFQEMPQPTEQHQLIQKGVGDWEGTVTMFHPGMPTEPAPATEKVTALGGFWTTSHFKSEFMGMPYSGHGQFGYDPAKKKYVSTWIDSMSSFLSVTEGEYDEKTNSMTMHWVAPGMTGEMEKHRSVNVIGENSYVMTFFLGEGEGVKSMEIKMKRKPMDASAPK